MCKSLQTCNKGNNACEGRQYDNLAREYLLPYDAGTRYECKVVGVLEGRPSHTIPIFAWGTEENNEVDSVAGRRLEFKPASCSVPDLTAPATRCKCKHQERKRSQVTSRMQYGGGRRKRKPWRKRVTRKFREMFSYFCAKTT
jgi:hypothetical protein